MQLQTCGRGVGGACLNLQFSLLFWEILSTLNRWVCILKEMTPPLCSVCSRAFKCWKKTLFRPLFLLYQLPLGVNFIKILHHYPYAENLQSQTASTKVFRRKIVSAKAAHKMLMKLTPRGHFHGAGAKQKTKQLREFLFWSPSLWAVKTKLFLVFLGAVTFIDSSGWKLSCLPKTVTLKPSC